jgi:hypothetical protein
MTGKKSRVMGEKWDIMCIYGWSGEVTRMNIRISLVTVVEIF